MVFGLITKFSVIFLIIGSIFLNLNLITKLLLYKLYILFEELKDFLEI